MCDINPRINDLFTRGFVAEEIEFNQRVLARYLISSQAAD